METAKHWVIFVRLQLGFRVGVWDGICLVYCLSGFWLALDGGSESFGL